MAQNIYDRPDFFDAYSQLPRSTGGLDEAPEWPALRRMLPNPQGLRVVDLGCGFGWFCRWARQHGAAQILGIDVSERMLARARAETLDEAVTYRHADLETIALPPAGFDLAYSSLALHYIDDAARLFATIHRALAPGGSFVFSTEHPIYTAPTKPAWTLGAAGEKIWPLDRYADEGTRTTDWLTQGVVKYHRRLATTLNLLLSAGLKIVQLEEFCPTPEQIAARPALEEERHRPTFLLVSAGREDRQR